jgi:hypothetical protein
LIVVFAELGGEKLLGRARELADSLGLRVLAVCSDSHDAVFSQHLILLGADEVIKYRGTKSVFDWANVLSSLLREKGQVSFLFGMSGLYTDAIFGRTYALDKERIGTFLTGIDSINEDTGAKYLRTWSAALQNRPGSEGKVSVFSFKSSAIPEPFEDSSRYGKTSETEIKAEQQKSSPSVLNIESSEFLDSSGRLTILSDNSSSSDEERNKAIHNVAQKYKADVVTYSSQVQEVYGPCIAIDVVLRHERELPRFHSELIAVNNAEDHSVISNVADLRVLTNDTGKILQELRTTNE